jgi:hypothetical protein
MRGPTPAHIDCFLVPRDRDSEPPSSTFGYVRILPPVGYATGVFSYDTRAYGSVTEASEPLLRELEPRISAYYDLVGARQRTDRASRDLGEQRDRIIRLEAERGVAGFVRRQARASQRLRELTVALTTFEANTEAEQADSTEKTRELATVPGTTFLEDEINEELRTAFRYPTRTISTPLELLERRRLTSSQNRTALMGALLAAVIGATSALWVSGASSSKDIVVTVVPVQTTPSSMRTPPTSPTAGASNRSHKRRGHPRQVQTALKR